MSSENQHHRQTERTFVVSAGRPHEPNSPVNPPVDFTSTYTYRPSVDQPQVYAREGIPSFRPLEELIAGLEAGTRSSLAGAGSSADGSRAANDGGAASDSDVRAGAPQSPEIPPALLFSSGLSAISAVLNLLPLGSHVILPTHSYMGFFTMAQQMADKGMITLHRVDIAETDQVRATLDEVASLARGQEAEVLLWIESPTNPMLEVADLPALTAEARRHGILTAVDNTFATPLRQRPLEHGADIVVHSVTKFLSGHSDVIMGAAVTSDPELHRRLHAHRNLHGTIPGPMEVFLALRGARTLAIRLDAAEKNAGDLARRLEALTSEATLPLRSVSYPGLPSHPQHARASAQLGGFGAIVTLDTGSRQAADAVLENLRLWTPATSLGGVESLAERRRRHPGEPETVPEGLIRLSVGIEDAEDLFDDLLGALRTAADILRENG
ncbi:trans-sulfuration enzyme family protein [Nesterenkonia lacusekhoensis]|uniref:Cystathionine gamma-synthase n=1 Tax=Nesterenkonia lacusekhoensis TaxID=150832 RepID=A0ABS4SYX8_9MICC|nr:cystathionine gamma-synthase [Nesterenkonia lacusekhoensis]